MSEKENISGSDAYSRLVSDPRAIRNFVIQSADFVKSRGFDGLSVEWQYPVCPQSNCAKGVEKEKMGFTKLIQVSMPCWFCLIYIF